MAKLTNKEIHILDDGLNYQFRQWGYSNPKEYGTYENDKKAFIDEVNTNELPDFDDMDNKDQWTIMCVLYCAYGIKPLYQTAKYNKSDVAKLNEKIVGRKMIFTIESINEAWDSIK